MYLFSFFLFKKIFFFTFLTFLFLVFVEGERRGLDLRSGGGGGGDAKGGSIYLFIRKNEREKESRGDTSLRYGRGGGEEGEEEIESRHLRGERSRREEGKRLRGGGEDEE